MSARISWNGGRNGWASFLIGFGWMPNAAFGYWGLHVYLGLWVLTIQSPDRKSSRKSRVSQ